MYPDGVWAFQVKLAIRRQGKEYTFKGPFDKDKFGQPLKGDNQKEVTIKGIYHEDHRWTESLVSEEEGSNVNRNPTESYILARKADTEGLKWGMVVVVSNKTYRLIKSRDIEGLGLFCDLVLQEVEPNGLQNGL